MTAWKSGALQVLAYIDKHGGITAKQVREFGVDPRRFCSADGWLKAHPEVKGTWVRGTMPPIDKQHPAEFAALKAKP